MIAKPIETANFDKYNSKLIEKRFKQYKIIISLFIILIIIIYFFWKEHQTLHGSKRFYVNFNYSDYQNNIITDEMKEKAGWEMHGNQIYFLNGIIRKYLPKNCLEIGVSEGGSSILILNAIKDIKNSRLVSLDLNIKNYQNNSIYTGWRVKTFFPELTKKWSFFVGDQPHKFLVKLNLKFDFLFLDTAHMSPGELINILEVFPFLNENAIIILHDINYSKA